jgi:cell division protein FtsB
MDAQPTSYVFAAPSPEESAAGPSRKRARTDATPEARKEARAHRNRLAAQASRDRRKVEFSSLHARVAALEAENTALRAGAAAPVLSALAGEPERARWAAENAALRERIRTLEQGWDVILKALAGAPGLPGGLLAALATPGSAGVTGTAPGPTITIPAGFTASPLPPTPSSLSSFASPSPLASTSTLSALPEPSSASPATITTTDTSPESARHLARVATAASAASLQRADSLRLRRLRSPSSRLTLLRALRRTRMADPAWMWTQARKLSLTSSRRRR